MTEIAENMLIVYITNEWFVLITLLNEVIKSIEEIKMFFHVAQIAQQWNVWEAKGMDPDGWFPSMLKKKTLNLFNVCTSLATK